MSRQDSTTTLICQGQEIIKIILDTTYADYIFEDYISSLPKDRLYKLRSIILKKLPIENNKEGLWEIPDEPIYD